MVIRGDVGFALRWHSLGRGMLGLRELLLSLNSRNKTTGSWLKMQDCAPTQVEPEVGRFNLPRSSGSQPICLTI